MTKFSEQAQRQNESKGNAWNQYITPRLLAIRSSLSDDAMKAGFMPYLKAIYDQHVTGLVKSSSEKDDWIRGRISLCEELLAFPETIERQIMIQEQAKKQEDSRGQAGY
jgi:hypothetical protein